MNSNAKVEDGKKFILFALLWLGGAFAGMNGNLTNVVLPDLLAAFEKEGYAFGNQLGSFIQSAFLLGWMGGGILIGSMADKIGRVKASSFSIILYSFFTALCAGVKDPFSFIGCRFFAGMGVGGEMVTISILMAEHFRERGRALATGALITSYQVGVFLSGAMVSLAGGWREAFALGFFPLFLALIQFFRLEESPDWKLLRKKALQNPPFWERVQKQKLLLGAITFGSFLVGYWASLSWIPTWIHNLPGSDLFYHVKEVATMTHGALAVLGCSLAGFAVNYFGRVRVIGGSLLMGSCISFSMFFIHSTFSPLILAEYGLLGVFIGLAQASLYIYLAELFPTPIRGQAVGLCLNAGRAFTALSVLFVGTLISLLGGYEKALGAFAIAYLFGFIAMFFAPETKNQLEEKTSCP